MARYSYNPYGCPDNQSAARRIGCCERSGRHLTLIKYRLENTTSVTYTLDPASSPALEAPVMPQLIRCASPVSGSSGHDHRLDRSKFHPNSPPHNRWSHPWLERPSSRNECPYARNRITPVAQLPEPPIRVQDRLALRVRKV